ncbi:MAG: TolC family protein [Cryomorphaceae bacterium]|nr:TolC family protein [Flavobacteriales bacterium]
MDITRFILSSLLVISTAFSANAQQRIDLNEALSLALEYNYDVRTAGFSREIDENLAAPGNAGLLPSVFLDGAFDYQLQNTEITFASIEQPAISAEGAQTVNYEAAAVVSYTLFNGGRRVYTLRGLESNREDARLREKLAMESTSLTVATRYLEALRQRDAVAIAKETARLSLERLNRASENYKFGSFTRLQLLNAEVDLRTDSIALAESELGFAQARRDLFLAIGLPADTSLAIDSNFTIMDRLDKESLLDGARSRNTAYLRARNEVYGAEQNLKASKADYYPTLDAQGGYRYSFSDFEANFLNTQENVGWNAGLSLRFYLFDGNRVRRNIQNARLSMEMASVEEARALNEISALINNAYDEYITSRKLLALSERNLNLAEVNFERSRDAFSTGQITGTELRDAQLNLARARNEISIRRIRTKLAEVGLLFEAGVLLE